MKWAPGAKREPPRASAASNDHRPACRESLCACLARLRERWLQRPRCRLAPRQPGRQKRSSFPRSSRLRGNDRESIARCSSARLRKRPRIAAFAGMTETGQAYPKSEQRSQARRGFFSLARLRERVARSAGRGQASPTKRRLHANHRRCPHPGLPPLRGGRRKTREPPPLALSPALSRKRAREKNQPFVLQYPTQPKEP